MNPIQENLSQWMSDPTNRITSNGTFTVKDFNNLNKVINNTEEDFLIFDNGGGRKFDISFDHTYEDENSEQQEYKVKNFIKHLMENHRTWVYSYQIDGQQTIVKVIK
jgi:hypothetical protein